MRIFFTCLLIASGTAAFAQPQFDAAKPIFDHLQPDNILLLDVNADGLPDIVQSVEGFGPDRWTIWWRRNDGAGTFSAPQRIVKELFGIDVLTAADIDGDGDQELLYGNGNGAWYRDNLGGAGLGAPVTLANEGVQDMATGDLNADGLPDVVMLSGSRVVYRRGLGGGMLGLPVDVLGAVSGGRAIACLDADNDGFDDVAFATGNTIKAARGGPGGPSSLVSVTTVPFSPERMSVHDRDGDGEQDLLVYSVSSNNQDLQVGWLDNEAGASLAPYRNWGTGLNVAGYQLINALYPFDPEGDGVLGLLLPIGDSLVYRRANITGTGFIDTTYGIGRSFEAIPADMDGDGSEDLVWHGAMFNRGYDLMLIRQASAGTMLFSGINLAMPDVNDITIGDTNADGQPDIIVANTLDETADDGLWIFPQQNDAFDSCFLVLPKRCEGRGLESSDWNADGFADLLTGCKIQWLSDGLGGFLAPDNLYPLFPDLDFSQGGYATDLDADGLEDRFVFGLANSGIISFVTVNFLQGTGSGLIPGPPVSYPAMKRLPTMADGNSDGLPDLYYVTSDNTAIYAPLTLTPAYVFGPEQGLFSMDNIAKTVLTDLTGDGIQDLLGVGFSSGSYRMFMSASTPTGPSLSSTFIPLPASWTSTLALIPGDFDGDGDEDVLQISNALCYLISNNGTTSPDIIALDTLLPPGPSSGFKNAVVLDPEGDGFPDVFIGITSGQYAGVLRIKNTGPLCPVPSGLAATPLGPSDALLSWTPEPTALGYRVFVRQAGTTATSPGTPTASPTFTASGLLPGTTYEWTVRSGCGFGNSTVAPVTSFTTPLLRDNAWNLLHTPWHDGPGGTLRIIDAAGRLVLEKTLAAGERWVPPLTPGWYVAQFTATDQLVPESFSFTISGS